MPPTGGIPLGITEEDVMSACFKHVAMGITLLAAFSADAHWLRSRH
jgi:hypothetical protein